MRVPRAQRRRGVLEPTIFAIVGIAILIGLGIWQLDRVTWKENLIQTVTARVERPAADLPPRASWPSLVQADNEYSRVTFPAEFLEGQEALVYFAGSAFRPEIKGPGFWVFAPARLSGGSIVMVNRGFVPADRKDPATRAEGMPHGSIDIVGVMRWPETRGMFVPADDVKGNVWYLRDPKAMAEAHRWSTAAPFYIEQESPVPPGGLPLPGKLQVQLPNNHMQYALTWFGLALGLAGVYVVWMVGHFRRR